MNHARTPRHGHGDAGQHQLDRTRERFLLARAQLAAGDAEELRREGVRRGWPAHRRRFD